MTERERHWQGLVDECGLSGLSQVEFCRRRGINNGTFCWWKRELFRRAGRRPESGGLDTGVAFSEFRSTRRGLAQVGTKVSALPSGAPAYELVLANGRSIRLPAQFDPQVLSRLIAAAESC